MQRILIMLGLLSILPLVAQAQVLTDAKIYVCSDTNGQVTLQNLGMRKDCRERMVRVPAPVYRSRLSSQPMPDPQPANGALMAGAQVNSALQQSRDASRIRILMDELAQAQQKLAALQTEASNPSSARLDSDLKKNLSLSKANVEALKREITQAGGLMADDLHLVFH